jgi:hypothetical protein
LTTFLALYRGDSIGAAKLLTVSTDPEMVWDFAARLLEKPESQRDPDPVLDELEQGRRRALRLVKSGAE